MKHKFQTIGGIILIGLAATFTAFQTIEQRKDIAAVNKIEGYYIFVDSKPIADYEYLGTVESKFARTPQYTDVRNKLIKAAKEQYPRADGLIMTFVTGTKDKAEVIKFK